MDKGSFIMRADYIDPVRDILSLEQIGALTVYLCDYSKGKTVEIEDPLVRMAFSYISRQADIEDKHYTEATERRKQAAIKGASARWSKDMPTDANGCDRIETHKSDAIDAVNDNVNVNVKDNDKDNVKDNVSFSIGETEKRKIFEKFFFRNMTEPNKEVIRYLDWGESTDWINKNGQKIKDVVKYSRFWTPEKEGKRFSPLALSILHKIWTETGNQDPAIQKLIFGIYKDSQVGSDLKLYTRQGAEKLAPYAKDIAAGFGFNIEIIQTN